MRVKLLVTVFVALVLASFTVAAAVANSEKSKVNARLSSYQEVPTLSTSGHGAFVARIDDEAQTISFTLTYGGLTTAAFMAHIHLGAPATAGGISAWLCGLPGTPAKTTCPDGTSSEAVVTGTITPADVVGPAGQGLAPMDFAALVRAIRADATYANVHSARFGGGEIRGVISGSDRDD